MPTSSKYEESSTPHEVARCVETHHIEEHPQMLLWVGWPIVLLKR